MRQSIIPFSSEYVISKEEADTLGRYAKLIHPWVIVVGVVSLVGGLIGMLSFLYSRLPMVGDTESFLGIGEAAVFFVALAVSMIAAAWCNHLRPLSEDGVSTLLDLCKSYRSCDGYRLQVLAQREFLSGDLAVVEMLRDQEIATNTRKHQEAMLRSMQETIHAKTPLFNRSSVNNVSDEFR